MSQICPHAKGTGGEPFFQGRWNGCYQGLGKAFMHVGHCGTWGTWEESPSSHHASCCQTSQSKSQRSHKMPG